jgi:ABC-type transport system involved in cytochrome bd biosynthesis fused ATPase/permease subunit
MLAAEQYDAVRRLGALLHKTRTAVASHDSGAEGRPSDDGVIRLREVSLSTSAAARDATC